MESENEKGAAQEQVGQPSEEISGAPPITTTDVIKPEAAEGEPKDSGEVTEERQRRKSGDTKMESMFRVFRQSFIEAIGAKNWKTLSGETVQITHTPEIEASLKRLAALHHLYNEMSKVLAQYLHAAKQLSQAEDVVYRFFTEAGHHEEDALLKDDLVAFGDKHKQLSKASTVLQGSVQGCVDHINVFLTKAIDDCFTTSKKYNVVRLEFDSYQTKVASLENEIASKGTSPKLEKDLHESKEKLEETKARHHELSTQLVSKVELLYELKVKNLREHLASARKAIDQTLADGLHSPREQDEN